MRTFGAWGGVPIADDAKAFTHAIHDALTHKGADDYLRKVDAVLTGESCDNTCAAMKAHISRVDVRREIELP
ncbi:glycosyltransferase family 1 protein, partial [Pseudomonas syringae pv. tagetis]